MHMYMVTNGTQTPDLRRESPVHSEGAVLLTGHMILFRYIIFFFANTCWSSYSHGCIIRGVVDRKQQQVEGGTVLISSGAESLSVCMYVLMAAGNART